MIKKETNVLKNAISRKNNQIMLNQKRNISQKQKKQLIQLGKHQNVPLWTQMYYGKKDSSKEKTIMIMKKMKKIGLIIIFGHR